MTGRREAKTKRSGHSGVSVDTPIYLKTGPVRIKPVQDMMFELDSTSTRGIVGSPKIDQTKYNTIGLAPFNIKHINCQEVRKSTTSLVSTSHETVGPASVILDHPSCQEPAQVPTKSTSSTHQAVGQDPVRMDHTTCQAVDKVPARSESVHHPGVGSNSSDRNTKYGFPGSMSFGSFTIAQLAGDGVNTTKVQPKYNAGVLQGNWFDDRMHPKYRPMHPPPLNTCNLDYRSTYKDSFLNHNLKDFSSVRPIKKEYSLPAWFVHDEVKKVSSRTRPDASKDQGHAREHVGDGKDPYKGHDLDPFKRRDEYKTGYEYTLDAFQENPRLWDKYRGRENYFKRKDRGNRYNHHHTSENVLMQAGDGPISADHSDDPLRTQRNNQTAEPQVADRNPGHQEGRRGNISNEKPGEPRMAGQDKSHSPDMSRHDARHTPNMDHIGHTGHNMTHVPDIGQVSNVGRNKPHAPDMGRHDKSYVPNMCHMGNIGHGKLHAPDTGHHDKSYVPNMCHMGNIGHGKLHASDMGHVAILRQLETDLKKLSRTTSEYKSNFKPMETSAVTTAAKERRERERVLATSRNISTFAF